MRISVHLGSLAAIRKLNNNGIPDPLLGAVAADLAGADGIVALFGNGEGALNSAEVTSLKGLVKSHLTLEIEPHDELLRKAMDFKPDQVTLSNDDVHSQSINLLADSSDLKLLVQSLHSANIEANALIDPELEQIKEAKKIGFDAITLNTSSYTANAVSSDAIIHYEDLEKCALGAIRMEMGVFARGGLTHRSVGPLASFGMIDEFILGRTYFARSIFVGMEKAMREVREAILHASKQM
ncbi:pyridoxine 5'-phosphate synthase [bacterium]|nr:pyridoxine 5'-phosphate synthase [bacterium]